MLFHIASSLQQACTEPKVHPYKSRISGNLDVFAQTQLCPRRTLFSALLGDPVQQYCTEPMLNLRNQIAEACAVCLPRMPVNS